MKSETAATTVDARAGAMVRRLQNSRYVFILEMSVQAI